MIASRTRSPLRGREEQVAAMRDHLLRVRSGVGAVLLVEGGPGLGKTRLLDECASIATGLSFRFGRGAAEPGRAVLGMEALLDALFEGADPLFPRGALSDAHASPEQQFWLLQDIQALIEEAALKGPLLICLDDLHWAGAGCAVAMRQLPQHLAERSVAAAETRAKLNGGVRSLQATAAHARGQWCQSIENLGAAVSLFDDGLRPLALASALEDLGRLHVRSGTVDAGIAAFDRALAIHVEARAAWDAARIRGRLRKLCVRRRIGMSERPHGQMGGSHDS